MSSIFKKKKEPHPSHHMEGALRWKHNGSASSLQLQYHCQRQSKLTECPTRLFGFSPSILSFYNIPGLLGMLSFVSHLSALKKKKSLICRLSWTEIYIHLLENQVECAQHPPQKERQLTKFPAPLLNHAQPSILCHCAEAEISGIVQGTWAPQ